MMINDQRLRLQRHGARLADGRAVTRELVLQIEAEELQQLRQEYGDGVYAQGRFGEAAQLFEQVALSPDFVEFLTLPAYEHIDL